MKIPKAIDENLTFLLAELDGQLARLRQYFAEPKRDTAQSLLARAGYSSNLANRLRKACLEGHSRSAKNQTRQLHFQSFDALARNLDLISRSARRAVRHAEDVRHVNVLHAERYTGSIKLVAKSLGQVHDALESRDSHKAVTIGQTRAILDATYATLFQTYTRDMAGSEHIEDLAHSLLTAHEFHRMGEALQSISEALLSICIGQTMQFERYYSLQSTLSATQRKGDDIRLQPLAETRSGSEISTVTTRDENGQSIDAVFKDGLRQKVKEERVGVKSWDSVYPGLAPKILSYEKRGENAALLIEHLDGDTFQDILLHGSQNRLDAAEQALHRTLRDVWRRTKNDGPVHLGAMAQLSKRIADVYRIHPKFDIGRSRIGNLDISCFETQIEQAAQREADLAASFSVYIHGDFNLDNVIYNPAERKIRFIDLHRSCYMDYVQDISVFMVSNYRLQVLDKQTRNRIRDVACNMHMLAAKFAKRNDDKTFEYRLALGLVRSFASSTRFVFDRDHAGEMFLRARYILNKVLSCPKGKEARFKLPIRELFSD